MKAVLLLSKIPSNLVGEPISEEQLYDAVDCLLSYVVLYFTESMCHYILFLRGLQNIYDVSARNLLF